MLIKVCGLKHEEDIDTLSAAEKVDLLGFIFVAESPRYVGMNLKRLSTHKKKVGVFRNTKLDEIIKIHERLRFDYIQLHGDESPSLCRELTKYAKVIKAFSIQDKDTFVKVIEYENCCELFLFDTPSKIGGGSGRQFDWSILDEYQGETSFLLSGGIGPQDVHVLRAMNHNKFKGIDINSRFETRPGKKDTTLIQAFLNELNHEIHS
jgi:phosphoribosylanthranilate isomerase